MGYAGTPGMVWGWLIAMFFIQCVAMSMAELCSSMPTSGGLYYASAVLAPPYVNQRLSTNARLIGAVGGVLSRPG